MGSLLLGALVALAATTVARANLITEYYLHQGGGTPGIYASGYLQLDPITGEVPWAVFELFSSERSAIIGLSPSGSGEPNSPTWDGTALILPFVTGWYGEYGLSNIGGPYPQKLYGEAYGAFTFSVFGFWSTEPPPPVSDAAPTAALLLLSLAALGLWRAYPAVACPSASRN